MNPKAKGSEFERYVCKYLTEWLTGKKAPYAFWRSPSSGAIATISPINKDLSGDIIGLIPEAEAICSIYSIETKTGYPKTDFWQLFKTIKNFDIRDFWAQCVNDANRANKLPMLIYRKKGKKIIVGIRDEERLKLSTLGCLPTLIINFCADCLPVVAFYDFELFWKNIKVEDIKGLKNDK